MPSECFRYGIFLIIKGYIMVMRTHYDNLKISRNATTQEIKKAYRRLAQQYHPDRNGNSAESQRIMKIINQAYAVLSDPESRRAYDRKLMEQEREEREAEQAKQRQQAHERQQAYERQQEQEKRQRTKEEYWRQEGYRQQKEEEIYRQQTAAQEAKTEQDKGNKSDVFVWIVILSLVFITIFFISISINPLNTSGDEASSSAVPASVEDVPSWVNETDKSNNLELELEAASSPESMQVEIENLRAQLEAAKAASEVAAEQQLKEQEEYIKNKTAQCRQLARNIGYYETLASLCEFTPRRSNNDIAAQWDSEECGNYMALNEATEEAKKSARNLEDKINQIDGSESYDNFCKGQWRFWKEIDDGQR